MVKRALRRTSLLLPVLFLLVIVSALPAEAQLSRQLVITNTDASSAPTVEVTLYGLDATGAAIDFANTAIVVQQDGVAIPAENVQIVPDAASVGTVTIFLIDIPPGVSSDIPTIQNQILTYGSAAHMQELVDYTAVYRVGAAGATRLLEATEFYNTVANLFATTLEPEPGVTALYDSVLGLLNNVETIKAKPELLPVMVVISDGTDAISEATGTEVPARAAELGIPIHTIWLDNQNISDEAEGRDYLELLAGRTGGVAAELSDGESVNAIWSAIDQRGRQSVIRFTAPEVTSGEHTVTISLASDPGTLATDTFTVPPEAPTIVLNLPPESRTLTLTTLDQQVENLRLSSEVRWLDDVDRQIVQAQLLVNGVVVANLDPGSLNSFDPLISSENLYVFGENRIQIAIEDEAGNRARSGEILLTINQGEETAIPEELQPGFFDRFGGALTWVLGCMGTGIMLVILFGALYFLRRSSLLRSLGLSNILYRVPFLRPYLGEVRQAQVAMRQVKHMKGRGDRVKGAFSRHDPEVRGGSDLPSGGTGKAPAYFEVMECQSQMPARIELTDVELHLGRSPKQSNLVFPDDITMSRLHATIVQEGIDYRIFDEQSTSGTFVNEQRVPDYGIQLIDRDEVRLGAVMLRFRQP